MPGSPESSTRCFEAARRIERGRECRELLLASDDGEQLRRLGFALAEQLGHR